MTGQIFESGGGTEGNAVDVPLSEPGGKTRFIGRFKVPTARKLARANDHKVDFIIAGTQKGGTSALDAYLRLDPQICLPHKVKEVHFFEADPLFDTGEPDYRLYHAFFKPRSWHRLVGEATPGYMYCEDVPRRIHAYNPDMKIILSLRNPIDRAFSHWNMNKKRGFEPLSFGDAIRGEEERTRATRNVEQ